MLFLILEIREVFLASMTLIVLGFSVIRNKINSSESNSALSRVVVIKYHSFHHHRPVVDAQLEYLDKSRLYVTTIMNLRLKNPSDYVEISKIEHF